MIVTEILDGQGLGNQMWAYAAARSIAEQLRVPFALLGSERFKGQGFLKYESEVGVSASEAINIAKSQKWKIFNEALFYDRDLSYLSSGFDSRVLSLSGTYKLNGLFQSEKYFFGELERPKRYFILDKSLLMNNEISDDTCVINLRGGEYKRHKNFLLPESYWTAAIENMKRLTGAIKFLVVTDDVRYARAMFPKFEVLDGGIGDCYAALYNAKYLILSNSTFAYFPVKTGGNSRVVIAPKYWARYTNSLKRWASTANLYESWMWQAFDGNLYTYAECLPECEMTDAEYESTYFVRTTLAQVQKTGIRRLVPTAIRRKAKKTLSIFLPRHFG